MTVTRRSERSGGAGRVLLLMALAPFAAVGGTAACGLGLTAAPTGASVAAGEVPDAGGSQDAGKTTTITLKTPAASPDAATVVGDAITALGSPLCNISPAAVCNPDDAGCSAACIAEVLGDAAAGTSNGTCDGHDGHTFACHVTAVHGDAGVAMVVPACSQPQGYPTVGTAEDACQSSDNCAIGFECVINDQNPDGGAAGVCRHYCCDNMCAGPGSFCDIETAVGGAVAVPVCAPQQPACELLKDTCPSGLTCQIVEQGTGLVACVKPGSATAGESCETAKCAKGFSCIGQFPNRECAQLCNVELNDCTNGTCTQNTVLSSNDSVVGICAQ